MEPLLAYSSPTTRQADLPHVQRAGRLCLEAYRELMDVARRNNGLENFGEDSFREGLEVLCGSLERQARLNATGEHVLRDLILRYLRQRLEVEEWYRLHPDTEDRPIEAPLFGVSLPRTGSTALSFLLSTDPGIRYLRVWESAQPFPPPSTVDGPDPRRGMGNSALAGSDTATRFVPSGIDGAYECLDLLGLSFASQIFIAYAGIPTYYEWLIKADLTTAYEYEKRVLKMLQWGEELRPWRLKTPMHILYMDHLDKAFPDAKFVMTHRDPTDVILSVATIYDDLHRHFTDHPDPLYVGELNASMWSEGMNRLIAFRDRPGNDERFYDIHFRAMQQDPIGEVRGLYRWLGEEVSPAFEQGMKAFWAENEGRETYEKPDPSVFGLDYDDVRARFAPYLERMKVWAPWPKA